MQITRRGFVEGFLATMSGLWPWAFSRPKGADNLSHSNWPTKPPSVTYRSVDWTTLHRCAFGIKSGSEFCRLFRAGAAMALPEGWGNVVEVRPTTVVFQTGGVWSPRALLEIHSELERLAVYRSTPGIDTFDSPVELVTIKKSDRPVRLTAHVYPVCDCTVAAIFDHRMSPWREEQLANCSKPGDHPFK